MRVLAGDIGGTHARVATFEVTSGRPTLVRETQWPSHEYDGLTPVVEAHLASENAPPGRACFGVAGPVSDGRCRLPNLGWDIDAAAIAEATGIASVRLINDWVAIGHGVLLVAPDQIAVIQEGRPEQGAPIALIGAGTGLGVAHLDPSVDPPGVHAGEGGHATFAARNEEEWALARYLMDRHGHASRERVLSGEGLVEVYTYLAASGYAPEHPDVRAEMAEDDPAAVVARHGADGDDVLCQHALGMFLATYGAVAADVALTVGARGGVFLAGGIAPKLLEGLRSDLFLGAFRDKGRLRAYVEAIPVSVVLDERVGLLGAAAVAAHD